MSSTIKIIDARNPPKDDTIHWSEAIPGRLYMTVGGQEERVVMAAQFAALDYTKYYPSGLAFVGQDGRAWPCTTDRLRPLNCKITWWLEDYSDF